jgi:hypothetical protein
VLRWSSFSAPERRRRGRIPSFPAASRIRCPGDSLETLKFFLRIAPQVQENIEFLDRKAFVAAAQHKGAKKALKKG